MTDRALVSHRRPGVVAHANERSDEARRVAGEAHAFEIGPNIVYPSHGLLEHVALQSGEGRFRWLHAYRGGVDDLFDAATAEFSDTGWVLTKEQMIDECWFGPNVPTPVANRLGDVAVVAHQLVSYYDPLDSGPFELMCRHGSMTAAEVYVPLVAGMAE